MCAFKTQILPLIMFNINYYKSGPPKHEAYLSDEVVEETNLTKENYYEKLPYYIKLNDDMGYMKKREFPHVPRIHKTSKKKGFEGYYSELQLYTSWRDEFKEFHPDNEKKCLEKFEKEREKIDVIKK